MFTGEFAAGATAFKGGPGFIDLHLVGFGAAPLALAPQCSIIKLQLGPLGGNHQTLGGFGGGFVGSKLLYIVEAQVHLSLSSVTLTGQMISDFGAS